MNDAPTAQDLLAALERQRAEIDTAIAVIKRQLGNGQPSPGPTIVDVSSHSAVPVVESDTFHAMSIPEATVKFLGMARKPRSTNEICVALENGGFHSKSKNFYSTVYSVLMREHSEKRAIAKVGKLWGLAEWYPQLIRERPVRSANGHARDARTAVDDTASEIPQSLIWSKDGD